MNDIITIDIKEKLKEGSSMKIELIYIYNLLLMMLYAITMAFSVSFFIREKNKKKKTLYLVCTDPKKLDKKFK